MTDLTTISSPNLTTILSITTNLISTNISTDQIATITNGNTTTVDAAVSAPIPIWFGFIGCLMASFFFGSNLIPVKKFSAGDGLFFQFVFCVAVFAVGVIVDLIIKNERFYPLVLIGGIR
jgi:hypothetical protein